MNKLFALSILLPSYLICTNAQLPANSGKPPVMSQDGINVYLNLSNSHDVENKNNTNATNQSGDAKPHVIHLIVTKQEETLSTKIKNALVTAGLGVALTRIPFEKLVDLAKTTLKRG
jgi:hypothetical protein